MSGKGLNKKLLAVGALMMVAMAAMAMVYYSAYGTSTITAKNIISGVFVEPNSSIKIYSPSVFTDQQIAKVNITLSDPNSSAKNTIEYTVVFESPLLRTGAMRTMVIKVYEDDGDYSFDPSSDTIIGIMSPLTPSLIYKASYTEGEVNELGSGKNVTYFLVANGVAFKPGVWSEDTTQLGIKVSVSLDNVT